MNIRIIWGSVFVLLWMGVIFYLSHQPAEASSQLSGGITDWIVSSIEKVIPFKINIELLHTFVRKTAHFTAYFVLGLLLVITIQASRKLKRASISLIIAVIYAITDEFHQTFIPGRSGELRDVLIDSVGALTGIIFFLIITFIWNRKKAARLRSS